VLGQLFTDLRWRPLDGAVVCGSPSMLEPAQSSPSSSLAPAAGLSWLPAPLEPGGLNDVEAAARGGMAAPEPAVARDSARAPELAPAPEPEAAAGALEIGRPGRAPSAGGAAPATRGTVPVLGAAAVAGVEAVRVEQIAEGGGHGRGRGGGVVPAVAPEPAGLQLGAAVAGTGVVSSVVEPLSMLSALSM